MMIRLRNRNQRRGSALVEGALCVTLMLAFWIGVVDIAKVLFLHQGLVERARAGVKYASTRTFVEEDVKNVVVYNSTTAGTHSIIHNLTPSLVTTEVKDAGTANARVQVTITNYPFEFVTPGLIGSYMARPIIASASHEPSLP